MENLNELIDFYEMAETDPQLLVWLLELRRHRENNWQQRAETAEAKLETAVRAVDNLDAERNALRAKLAELEKQASEQKPFMYGIMTANGDAHFEDFCVSSDPGLLEDVIWEWNNTLADNEPKNRVVALFTRPAPAINLPELVLDENDNPQGFTDWYEHHFATQPYKGALHVTDCENAWRAAILRHIEEAG